MVPYSDTLVLVLILFQICCFCVLVVLISSCKSFRVEFDLTTGQGRSECCFSELMALKFPTFKLFLKYFYFQSLLLQSVDARLFDLHWRIIFPVKLNDWVLAQLTTMPTFCLADRFSHSVDGPIHQSDGVLDPRPVYWCPNPSSDVLG